MRRFIRAKNFFLKKRMNSCLLCRTESTYRHQANIDDEVVTMEILDTAGQVRQTFSFEDSNRNIKIRAPYHCLQLTSFIWQGVSFLPLEDCKCMNKLKCLQT